MRTYPRGASGTGAGGRRRADLRRCCAAAIAFFRAWVREVDAKTLFGCIELTAAAGELSDEQIHIMELFRLGNTHGLLRKVCPAVHEMQYCPDCKTIVSTQSFCCALAKEYREKCDAN